jgi:putative hydroxymethylpyrimidine transport system substrate-binding protein
VRFFFWISAVGVAAALLAGCGGNGGDETTDKRPQETERRSQDPRRAWITLDGWEGAENVGILMAEKRGYFEEAGIDVFITSPGDLTLPVKYVTNRTVEFGVSHQPQVAIASEKGVPVVAVGSLLQEPTMAMIWLKKSGIDGIADLKGKTVAIPGLPFQEDFLQSLLRRAGLTLDDVEVKEVGYELVSALASGRADAIFGGSWNIEGAELEARGLGPVMTPVQDLGIPGYDELVLIARTDVVSEDPQLVRDVVSAVVRGTAAAVEDPEGALRVVEESGEANPKVGPRATEAQVEATLPLLSETGYMDPGQASDLLDWMQEQGFLQRALPTSALLTNQFVESG